MYAGVRDHFRRAIRPDTSSATTGALLAISRGAATRITEKRNRQRGNADGFGNYQLTTNGKNKYHMDGPTQDTKPIVYFDIESTGLDVSKDRILTLSAVKMSGLPPSPMLGKLEIKVNPGRPIPSKATAVHGITDNDVLSCPYFIEKAEEVLSFLDGCDVCGFNAVNFDVPFLWEELHRAGRNWNTEGMRVLDPGTIFKKKEERTLEAAVKFYCGRELDGAHDAANDTAATVDVFASQLTKYEDVGAMSIDELARLSRFDNRIDLAGKLVRDRDGDAVYNIGKAKGTKVFDDPGFGRWMMTKDFTAQTKKVLSQILNDGIGQ